METLQRDLHSFLTLSPQQCVNSLPNLSPYFSPSSALSSDSVLEALLQLCETHPNHGKVLFDAFSWDIWDLLYHRTLLDSQDNDVQRWEADWALQVQATLRLSESVSVKELRLMFFEKMDSQDWTYPGVKWLCYVFQLLLVGSTAQSPEDCVKACRGMFAVFHAVIQSLAEAEPGRRKSILSCLCYDVLHMLRGVASMSTSWATHSVSVACPLKETDPGLHRILLQFLYTFAADVSLLQLEDDITVRDAWCGEAVSLLLYLLDHQVQDVLNFHRQIGFEVNQQLKAKQHSSTRSNSKTQRGSSRVLEMVQTDCGESINVSSTLKSFIQAHNTITLDELIPTEMLLNHHSVEDFILLDNTSKQQPVVGLVFLLQHWLYYVLQPGAGAHGAYSPLGLHRDVLEGSFRAVLRCLLSIDKLAAQEGLRALLCLYPTRGRLEDMLAFLPSAGCGRVFLSSCLTLTFDELQQDYVGLLHRPSSAGFEEEVSLSLLCMQSAQTWHTMQCIVTAITMCQDVSLRSQAFHAWKCYLVQFEGWSVFELLFQLLKQCPYESMRAMLFEVVKVFIQLHAHPQLQACSAHSTQRNLRMSTEARAKYFATPPSNAKGILGDLKADMFDVRSVVSRYSSLSTATFHRAIFSIQHCQSTVCYSLLAVEYFVLHFIRDCCLESFTMNSNLLEEVNVQVNILQFLFSKLLAATQSDQKLLNSFFAMHLYANQHLDLHASQVLLDLLVVLDVMQKQLQSPHVEVKEIDRLKAEVLQVNLTMAEEKINAVITGLLSC